MARANVAINGEASTVNRTLPNFVVAFAISCLLTSGSQKQRLHIRRVTRHCEGLGVSVGKRAIKNRLHGEARPFLRVLVGEIPQMLSPNLLKVQADHFRHAFVNAAHQLVRISVIQPKSRNIRFSNVPHTGFIVESQVDR